MFRVTLDLPIEYKYRINPMDGINTKTCDFFDAVENIKGVASTEYDFSDRNSFFVTVTAKSNFDDIKKLIKDI